MAATYLWWRRHVATPITIDIVCDHTGRFAKRHFTNIGSHAHCQNWVSSIWYMCATIQTPLILVCIHITLMWDRMDWLTWHAHHNTFGTIGLTQGDMYVDHPNHHLGPAARYCEIVLCTHGATTQHMIWEQTLGYTLGALEACSDDLELCLGWQGFAHPHIGMICCPMPQSSNRLLITTTPTMSGISKLFNTSFGYTNRHHPFCNKYHPETVEPHGFGSWCTPCYVNQAWKGDPYLGSCCLPIYYY